MQRQNFKWQEMTMGTCYYPEHWDKSLWEQDIERMLDCGISVIRIAEFSWNKIEPEEGTFTFGFFDEFLELCRKKDIKVIFGTPTATPPAWLTEKYPEVLNAAKDGTLYRHGGRRHYNYNSPVYNRLSARIVEEIGKHYGKHPAIVGWQIDNELNCETCEFYSEADSKAFREFAKEKYGSLEALNKAWGTAFWNQTYTSWEQIYVPRLVLSSGINPHMHLDYFRFISESAVRFCKMQADILRKYCKKSDFITTNGMFWNIDNHRMAEECLDVYTYDSYPNFAYGLAAVPDKHALKDRHWSKNLNEVRSICRHFGIMEQQSGANGWTTRMESPAPRPGQLKLWAMQSVAHGADFVSFFRWRTSTIGTEIYWHGILDYDNRDNRKLAEVKDFYQMFKKLDPVCGAEYVAAFALLKDYDNVWDTEVDVWHRRVAEESEEEIFAAAELSHTPYDVVYLRPETDVSDLEGYPVVFYPHPVILDEKRAALLEEYVSRGGTLIVGCRSGYKDMQGHCVMLPQPGLLQKLTGTDVKDFTFVNPREERTSAVWGQEEMETPVFNDVLTPLEGTKVLASYKNGYYAGEAALTEHAFGKGRVLHLGSAFSKENTCRIFRYTGIYDLFADLADIPETMEAVLRRKDKRYYLFVLNFQKDWGEICLKQKMRRMDTGEICKGKLMLPAYGTVVLVREEERE